MKKLILPLLLLIPLTANGAELSSYTNKVDVERLVDNRRVFGNPQHRSTNQLKRRPSGQYSIGEI